MLGRTLPELVFIRVSIALLRSIAPLSIAYTALVLLRFVPAARRAPLALELYAAAEAAWYVLFFLPRRAALQRPALHPPLRPRAERRALFHKSLATAVADDPAGYIRGWCGGAPLEHIGRGDAADFFCWGFLNAQPDQAEPGELDEYVLAFERVLGRRLHDGRGRGVRAFRLTVDPVYMLSKPLAFQAIIFVVDLFTSARLWRGIGLALHRPAHCWRVIPPRPQYLLARARSPAPDLGYWLRPHTSRTTRPIVFLHGIGIGLYPYVPFLGELARLDAGVGILAVEMLPISFRLVDAPISSAAFTDQLGAILGRHGIDTFALVGHSYGCILSKYILVHPALGPRVRGALLIDPVPLLLHLPYVAFNFVRRPPTTANEWQLWYFASRDMGVSHALSRHFFWSENELWKEDLGRRGSCVPSQLAGDESEEAAAAAAAAATTTSVGAEPATPTRRSRRLAAREGANGAAHQCVDASASASASASAHSKTTASAAPAAGRRCAVVLSGLDLILHAGKTWEYLTGEPPPPAEGSPADGSEYVEWRGDGEDGPEKVLYYPAVDHAQVFDTPARRRPLVECVRSFIEV